MMTNHWLSPNLSLSASCPAGLDTGGVCLHPLDLLTSWHTGPGISSRTRPSSPSSSPLSPRAPLTAPLSSGAPTISVSTILRLSSSAPVLLRPSWLSASAALAIHDRTVLGWVVVDEALWLLLKWISLVIVRNLKLGLVKWQPVIVSLSIFPSINISAKDCLGSPNYLIGKVLEFWSKGEQSQTMGIFYLRSNSKQTKQLYDWLPVLAF